MTTVDQLQPLIDETRGTNPERRSTTKETYETARRIVYTPDGNREETYQEIGLQEREGVMLRITKALLDPEQTRALELFSMDTLPIFRKMAHELLAKGWVPTIRKNSSDRFGTPIYPWENFGESEKVNEDGRFIALVRMPRNMTAAEFIKPMEKQEVTDAAETNTLGFGPRFSRTSHIVVATCDTANEDPMTGEQINKPNGNWDGERILPNMKYACVPLEQIKQYGTGLFDGIGVEMNKDGEVLIFRLKEHHKRMSEGGKLLGMPEIPYELFERMVKETVQANWQYIPPAERGRLYIRPNWFDHGPQIKVGNSGRFMLLMLANPIGSAESYFTPGRKKFFMAKARARVAEGGNAGCLKKNGEYSGTIDLIEKAGEKGMTGVIFTNFAGDRIEETNASSVMFIERRKDGRHRIITPSLNHGTILDSVTRKTIITLAREKGWTVEERDISPDELSLLAKQGDLEAIAVGTAAAIAPIHEIQVGSVDQKTNELNENGELIQISGSKENGRGPVSAEIFHAIMAVKSGLAQKEIRTRLTTETNPETKQQLEAQLAEQESWLTIVPPPEE